MTDSHDHHHSDEPEEPIGPLTPPFRAHDSAHEQIHTRLHAPIDSPTIPIYEMSVQNCRLLDELATTRLGIPSIVLMENAAIALAEHARAMLAHSRSHARSHPRSHDILIATGPGNNAGDGFAAARQLCNQGDRPTIVMATPPEHITGDAKVNLDIITKMNLPIIDAQTYLDAPPPPPSLIIDALLGTGLTRPISGLAAKLIEHLNSCRESGTLILAADVPSGLNAQTGEPMGDPSKAVICADRTLTFAALKDGFRSIEAQSYLGELFVASIGLPNTLLEELGTRLHQPHDKAQANRPGS